MSTQQHNTPPAFFIDEERNIYDGEEALQHLHHKNDSENIDPAQGILSVDRTRWEEAQRYEKRTWLEDCRMASNDRNDYHYVHFAQYAPLRGLKFQRGIELGCGPFTNMRLILEQCRINEVSLLDPLLLEYFAHPFCRYRKHRLGGLFKEFPALSAWRSSRTLLRNSLNAWKIGGVRGKPVTLISSAIESFSSTQSFDLVVMVNVLEHCQNANLVLAKVLELLKPGGIFVFGDTLYDARNIQRFATQMYDAGHPLRVDRSVIKAFLQKHFHTMMQAEYQRNDSFKGVQFVSSELYTIVRKHSGEEPQNQSL